MSALIERLTAHADFACSEGEHGTEAMLREAIDALSQGIEAERLADAARRVVSAVQAECKRYPMASSIQQAVTALDAALAPVAPCKGCNATPCHCDPRDPLAAARRGGYEEA